VDANDVVLPGIVFGGASKDGGANVLFADGGGGILNGAFREEDQQVSLAGRFAEDLAGGNAGEQIPLGLVGNGGDGDRMELL